MTRLNFQTVKLLLLDVDGVLTSGQIIYSGATMETKVFNVKDGLGIRLLQSAGIEVGIITGRTSDALSNRCKDLGITMLYDGVKDKAEVFKRILAATGISADEVAFIGDDLPDLPVIRMAGVGVAVADAHDVVKQHADMTTDKNGGDGAVREVCEMILESKNLLEKIIGNWL